jgi:hypothetical protein
LLFQAGHNPVKIAVATLDGTVAEAVTGLFAEVPAGWVHPEQTIRGQITKARPRNCLCTFMNLPVSSRQKKGL